MCAASTPPNKFLNSMMGMADTMMVSRVGSEAISSVSLVDSINTLIIQVFAALATGGSIVCSQYIGHHEEDKANEAARQLVLVILVIATLIMAVCIGSCDGLLKLIFGSVEPAVMKNSRVYFLITSVSFPFFSLFQAGSAFYRAGGNSRFPMLISITGNAINIIGNAVLIFGFNMGVTGAAISTLFSRMFCFVVIAIYLRNPDQIIVIKSYLKIKPNLKLIKRILHIGVPSGIENGMFQFGKLAIQSSVSTLATYAIAAQAMTIIMENINGIVGIAIGIGLMTVVGQTMGAGRIEEAKYYIVKLTKLAEIGILVSCIVVLLISKPIMLLADMEEKSMELCFNMIIWITIVKPLAWVGSFIPAYGLRAAGDVKFSMLLGSISMWTCRVAISVFLIRVMGFGPIAVWIGMFSDWTIRSIAYFTRFISGKWLNHKVI